MIRGRREGKKDSVYLLLAKIELFQEDWAQLQSDQINSGNTTVDFKMIFTQRRKHGTTQGIKATSIKVERTLKQYLTRRVN